MGLLTATLKDDRGRDVELISPRGAPSDDPQLAAALARISDHLQTRREKTATDWLIAIPACIAITGVVIAIPILGPGSPGWLMPVVMFGMLLPLAWLLQSRRRRRYSVSIADSVLRIGRCASCGYSLQHQPVAPDNTICCPECNAAWDQSRLFFNAPTDTDAAYTGELARNSPFHQWARMWIRRETIADARGRSVPIADLRLRPLEDEIGAAAAAEIRRRLLRGTLFSRLVPSILTAVVALVYLLLIFGVFIRGRMGISGFVAIFWVFIIASLGFSAWRRWTGRTPKLAKKSADILCSLFVCPSCAASLRSAPESPDGCTTCPRCAAAWRLSATPSPTQS